MHDSAYRIGELVMRAYSDLPNAKILEVGSLNVNGCLRDAAAATTNYVGLDLEEGPSVDHVITPGSDFPVEDNSFDLVMASSVFEHDAKFWDTFIRMCRAARPGGHIYVNAPSNGTVHRYPMDCWRFYPDAGLALADYAQSQGLEIDLIESFVGNRHSDVWNDFVAVFRKGPTAEPMNTAFVYYRYPSMNARTWQSRAVYNESDSTEDMRLISDLRARGESLADEMARLSASLADTESNNIRVTADNEHLLQQVATLESNLRQRQEEIEQAWSMVQKLTDGRDKLEERLNEMQAVQEHLQSEFDNARRDLIRVEAVSEFKQQQFSQHEDSIRLILVGVARLKALELEPSIFSVQAQRLHQEWSEQSHPLAELADFLLRVSERTHSDHEVSSLHTQKATLHSNVEMLLAGLEEKELAVRKSQEQVAALTQSLTELRNEALEYHRKAAKALELVEILQTEKKQYERASRANDDRLLRKEGELNWMRGVYHILVGNNIGIKGFLPPSMRRGKIAQTLKNKDYFDGQAYLEKYPDVSDAGMDPLDHYILHGMSEGRFVDS